MTTESLAANIAALKALPGLLFGPQWRIRLSALGGNLFFVAALLAQMDWSQGDLAALLPPTWKPWATKLSLTAASALKVYELIHRRRRDLAAPSAPAA